MSLSRSALRFLGTSFISARSVRGPDNKSILDVVMSRSEYAKRQKSHLKTNYLVAANRRLEDSGIGNDVWRGVYIELLNHVPSSRSLCVLLRNCIKSGGRVPSGNIDQILYSNISCKRRILAKRTKSEERRERMFFLPEFATMTKSSWSRSFGRPNHDLQWESIHNSSGRSIDSRMTPLLLWFRIALVSYLL